MTARKRMSLYHERLLEYPEIDAFIADLIKVYKKHGLALRIDLTNGIWANSFQIVDLVQTDITNLERALVHRTYDSNRKEVHNG